jgi:glycosyltransferase involved in cell wall biosynthesis
MKIAITGTRGIPNRYGGFEQFAEQLSVRLAQRGHDVLVYNPSFHPVRKDEYNKVKIIRRFSPEKYIGPAANYLYDFLCLRDAIKRKADIILECGYATAAPSFSLLNFRKTELLINPDGMEWQRPKWSPIIRLIIRISEKAVAKTGFKLVCDNPELVNYYKEKYNVDSIHIPYGADIFKNPDEEMLKALNVRPYEYFLVIARLEPENNIRVILKGFLNSRSDRNLLSDRKLLIVGDPINRFGRKLMKEFAASSNILFTKDVFNQNILDNLRYYSKAYFHGHSAGGTNPSLLEAMAAGSLIIVHDNKFNRNILKDNALYFKNETDITTILLSEKDWMNRKKSLVEENLKIIRQMYQWEEVTNQYEDLFKTLICKNKKVRLNTEPAQYLF